LRLVERPDRQPEGDRHRAKKIFGVELGGDKLCRDQLAGVDLLEEAAHERGFPGANLTCDDDEAFALMHAVLQIGEGALVATAAVEECRVRVELKRLAGEPEESLVHVAT